MTTIKVNGKLLAPTNPTHWAVDRLRGVHQISIGKDLRDENRWGLGVNVIPGPPQATDFALEAWVEGDGSVSDMEARISDFMSRFRPNGYSKNSIMEVDNGHPLGPVHCPFRVRSVDPQIDYQERRARIKIVMENIWGVWKSTTATTHTAYFDSVPIPTVSGDQTVFDAEIVFSGPVTNPKIESQNRYFQFNGTIPAGSHVRIRCTPISAILNGTASVLGQCDWWGSQGRGLDITPGDLVWASGTGTNTNSRWQLIYNNVIY